MDVDDQLRLNCNLWATNGGAQKSVRRVPTTAAVQSYIAEAFGCPLERPGGGAAPPPSLPHSMAALSLVHDSASERPSAPGEKAEYWGEMNAAHTWPDTSNDEDEDGEDDSAASGEAAELVPVVWRCRWVELEVSPSLYAPLTLRFPFRRVPRASHLTLRFPFH